MFRFNRVWQLRKRVDGTWRNPIPPILDSSGPPRFDFALALSQNRAPRIPNRLSMLIINAPMNMAIKWGGPHGCHFRTSTCCITCKFHLYATNMPGYEYPHILLVMILHPYLRVNLAFFDNNTHISHQLYWWNQSHQFPFYRTPSQIYSHISLVIHCYGEIMTINLGINTYDTFIMANLWFTNFFPVHIPQYLTYISRFILIFIFSWYILSIENRDYASCARHWYRRVQGPWDSRTA